MPHLLVYEKDTNGMWSRGPVSILYCWCKPLLGKKALVQPNVC